MSKNRGRVEAIKPLIEKGRLKVRLTVAAEDGRRRYAYLPDRELSALLPRSILLDCLRDVPQEMLETIDPMMNKLIMGRQVRTWSYAERRYASFLPWRSVRFSGP